MQLSMYPFTHTELPILLLSEEYKCKNKIYPIIAPSYYLKHDNLYHLDNRDSILNIRQIGAFQQMNSDKDMYLSSNFVSSMKMNKNQDYLNEIFQEYNNIYINAHYSKTLNNDSIVNSKIKEFDTKTELILNHLQKIQHKFEFFEPNIPIIMVGSLIEFCNQGEMVAKISLELNKRGFNSVSIVNNPDFELIGCYHYPKSFFSEELNNSAKIQMFNNFVKWLIKAEKCEILILEVPGSLIKFSNNFANEFGVEAYMVSQALMSDTFILCSPYLSDDILYYTQIVEYLRNKFDFNTKFIHISNTLLNVHAMEFETRRDYFFMNEKLKDHKIEHLKFQNTNNNKFHVNNLLLDDNFTIMINSLLEMFS